MMSTNLEAVHGRSAGIAQTALAASITRAASKQTYYTVRYLVDRDLVPSAYRAYAYFRWVDDCLDLRITERDKRLAFVERQQALIDCCYRGERPPDLTAEERLIAELIESDSEANSGLQLYIRNMMAVMAFDAGRRGRLVSQLELSEYSRSLAIAVTEALHYFIGHNTSPLRNEARYLAARYLAATAAHITHMLRDTFDDAAAGYFNIPQEFLNLYGITPWDVENNAYRSWVQGRVDLARVYFDEGKAYLAQLPSARCRIAGYAYIARFEGVLDAIEREGYRLRPAYPERKSLKAGMSLGWAALALALNGRRHHEPVSRPVPAR
jgi:phytoene/squalene synthetase